MAVYKNIDKLLLLIYYVDDKNVSINMRLRARAYNINVIIPTYFFTTRRTYIYIPIGPDVVRPSYTLHCDKPKRNNVCVL